jgi:hypothetical protein
MSSAGTRTERYIQVESSLALLVVLLKIHVLHGTWGRLQGFDPYAWLDVFHATHWFAPLPPVRLWAATYHPPLSYLLGRLLTNIIPNELQASQALSTVALVIAFFCVRQLLRRIGYLWTLPGLWLLYGGISIPVVISIGVETTYDSWVLTWFMMAFTVSVGLFWNPPTSVKWWKENHTARGVTLLGLVFAAGLLNKYTGLLSFCLPYLVILVRRGIKATFRELLAPTVAVLLGIVIAFPLYYERNYKVEHTWTPAAMEWQRKDDLVKVRAKRDADPVAFIANMLRYPKELPANPQETVLDSFLHASWVHTWFRDSLFGHEPEPALTVSRKYSRWFAGGLLLGSAWFFARLRHIAKDWRDLGWMLLAISALFCGFALFFGWKYPLWDWKVFKTKYLTPALFWIPYAVSIGFSDSWLTSRRHRAWVRGLEDLAFFALVVFVVINHLLPFY